MNGVYEADRAAQLVHGEVAALGGLALLPAIGELSKRGRLALKPRVPVRARAGARASDPGAVVERVPVPERDVPPEPGAGEGHGGAGEAERRPVGGQRRRGVREARR